MTMNGGIHLFKVLDSHGIMGLLFSTFIEVIIFVWIYGLGRLLNDASEMSMHFHPRARLLAQGLFRYVIPMVLLVLMVLSWTAVAPTGYGQDYVYPPSVQALGWFLELNTLVVSGFLYPAYAVITALVRGLRGAKLRHVLLEPTSAWPQSKVETRPEDVDKERQN